MTEGSGLRHIEVDGMVNALDFEDGLINVTGPDEKYLNNILGFTTRRFDKFRMSLGPEEGKANNEVTIKCFEQVLTDDVDTKEKCFVEFASPVHVQFVYSEKESLLSVNVLPGREALAARKSPDWMAKLGKKEEEK